MELSAADNPLQAIHFPHELQHEAGRRLTPHAFRRIGLFDVALAHHHHPVGNFHRLFLIVGDEHAGKFQLFMQLTQPAAQLFTHLRIQRAERFIQQQNLRLYRQGARQRHALFLTTGQLRRIAIRQVSQLHHLQQFGHFGFNRRGVGSFAARQHGQAKGDVIEHRHMAEQRIVLEDEAHFTVAGVHPADVGTVEADMTAGLMLQTGDNSQQGGFSGARGPQQRNHLSGRDIQRDIIQHLGATKRFLNIGNLNAHDFPPVARVFPDWPDAIATYSLKTGSE